MQQHLMSLYLVPTDLRTLKQVMAQTHYASVQELFSGALQLFAQMWIVRGPQEKYPVKLVNETRGWSYDILVTTWTPEMKAQLTETKTRSSPPNVRFLIAFPDHMLMRELLSEGAGVKLIDLTGTILSFYFHVVEEYAKGYRLFVELPKGDCAPLRIPGLIPVEETKSK